MELFARELGQGAPVVIMHGLYGSSDNWLTVGRMLAEKYRVILVDLRNHGQSPSSSVHTYQAMSNDLLELFNRLNLSEAMLVGHSMGGKVAMQFTYNNPTRVSSLVVADILPYNYINDEAKGYGEARQHAKIISALLALKPELAESRGELDKKLAQTIPSKAVRQFLLKNVKRNSMGRFEWQLNVPVIGENIELLMGAVLPVGGDAPITVKTLFIKGQNSNYVFSEGVSKLGQFFTNFDVKTIPNAGHWLHAENPEAVINEMLQFWNPLS
ncbi:MAG: alpha/beta fold hydrolase [Bacteroidales bacterium]|nr:alpha/beta fold hydrolase [Tenuifilaceae bacterium]